MVWLLNAIPLGAIIASTNEKDRKAAANTVRGRDFSLFNPVSRQALLDWLEDLMQKLQGDRRVPSKITSLMTYTEDKQCFTRKISKMISFVRDDVPKIISMGEKPFYGSGGVAKQSSDWIDLDDVVLMSVFLKSKILCFNKYKPFDTSRP